MVGVSLVLVKMVETGQQPMAKSFARKILIATGARFDWPQFDKARVYYKPLPNGEVGYIGIGGEAMAHAEIDSGKRLGRKYTKEHFDWHRRFFKSNPAAAELALKEIVPTLKELFMAAAKSNTMAFTHRLPAIRASLWDWMAEADKAFGLGLKLPNQ